MTGFVYIWYDRKHKRYYIGSHWGTEDDGYICSSYWMKRAKKLRPEDFKRRILSRGLETREALLEEEQRWMNMMKDEELKGVRYYNLVKKVGHWHGQGDGKIKTVKEKLSAAWTLERKARYTEIRKRQAELRPPKSPKEPKIDMRHVGGMRGKSHSEETKKKMAESAKNRPKTYGRPCSEETKQKIREAAIRRHQERLG